GARPTAGQRLGCDRGSQIGNGGAAGEGLVLWIESRGPSSPGTRSLTSVPTDTSLWKRPPCPQTAGGGAPSAADGAPPNSWSGGREGREQVRCVRGPQSGRRVPAEGC